MKVFSLTITALLSLLFFACSSSTEEQTTLESYPTEHLLVEAPELNTMLQQEDLFLVDARTEIDSTLIPGAVHFAARQELADPDHPVDNYLVGPQAFQEKMRSIGLDSTDRVVIYDGGNSRLAARLFYALEYYGFTNASILNGGLQAWVDEEFPTTGTPESTGDATGNFASNTQEARFCDYETVVEASSDPDKIIFDVRSEEEYTGERKRAEKSGHIPNAVNLEWTEVLEPEGIPYFLPADEIREKYASVGLTPDKEIIPHCQSNVRGSHAYFTLRLMGYDSVRPYEGSWTEYGNREESVVVQ